MTVCPHCQRRRSGARWADRLADVDQIATFGPFARSGVHKTASYLRGRWPAFTFTATVDPDGGWITATRKETP